MKKIQLLSAFTLLSLLTGCAPCDDSWCSPCGEVTYVHKYGVQVDPEYWTATGQSGEVITNHRDGSVEVKSYNGGALHGRCTLTYPYSEQLRHVEEYNNNVCAKRQIFTEGGSPEFCTDYLGEGCTRVTQWYNCGTPRCIETYNNGLIIEAEYFDPQHNRESWVNQGQGERVQRDRFGQFLCLEIIRDGYMVQRTNYHPNGTIKEVIPYDTRGIINGVVRTYNPDGSPNTVETWTNNQQHGTTVTYQNGEKATETPYVSGKKHGVEKRFLRGEYVTQEVTYYEDYVHGPTTTYMGDSVRVDWYYRGKVTTRTNYEAENGATRAVN